MKAVLWLCMLIALAGCAEKWAKPGATPADFEGMKAACNSRSYQRFPPLLEQVQVNAGSYTPAQTICNGVGNSVQCYTTGGQYVPPAFMPIDQNQSARNDDVRACLYENGWTPVKE